MLRSYSRLYEFKTDDIENVLENVLYEFPTKEINVELPRWFDGLSYDYPIKRN